MRGVRGEGSGGTKGRVERKTRGTEGERGSIFTRRNAYVWNFLAASLFEAQVRHSRWIIASVVLLSERRCSDLTGRELKPGRGRQHWQYQD